MNDPAINGVPKTHPASREILPDDPMEMRGFEVPGDSDLMLKILVEEYARIGWGAGAIMQLACNANYTAFHALRQSLGEAELRRRVKEIIGRCGVMRINAGETEPLSERLVQIKLPE
jgi:hypothetical protein